MNPSLEAGDAVQEQGGDSRRFHAKEIFWRPQKKAQKKALDLLKEQD